MITTSTNKNTRHENAVNLGLSASNKVHCIVKQLDAKQLLAMHSNHHAEHQKCRNFLAIYSQTVHVSTDIEQLARTMLCLLVFSRASRTCTGIGFHWMPSLLSVSFQHSDTVGLATVRGSSL